MATMNPNQARSARTIVTGLPVLDKLPVHTHLLANSLHQSEEFFGWPNQRCVSPMSTETPDKLALPPDSLVRRDDMLLGLLKLVHSTLNEALRNTFRSLFTLVTPDWLPFADFCRLEEATDLGL